MAVWYVYLIRTKQGNLYTGIATDVGRRFAEHQEGGMRAAKCLRGRGPLRLVWATRIGARGLALQAEQRIKRLAKLDKERLAAAKPKRAALLHRLGLGQKA